MAIKNVDKKIKMPQDVPPQMERQFVSPEQPRQMGRMSEQEVAGMLGATPNGEKCKPLTKAKPPGKVTGTPNKS